MKRRARECGCKNGDFGGNINAVDHGIPVHLTATQITGYLRDPAVPNARDVCGYARVNEDPSYQVQFRVHLVDSGEPGFFSLQEWQMCGDLNMP